MLDLKTITADDFEKHLDKDFFVGNPDGADFVLTLFDVTRRPSGNAPAHCRQDPFMLRFRAAKGLEGPQGTYLVKTPDGEEVSLFLVPLGPESNAPRMSPEDHMIFQCIFN